jgi:hypothetical protein
MHSKLLSVRRAATLSGIALSAVLTIHAQAAPPVLEGKTAEQAFKNIQVLKGTPAEQLNQTMHLISSLPKPSRRKVSRQSQSCILLIRMRLHLVLLVELSTI